MPSAENPDSVKLRSIADAFSMVLEASPLDNGSPLVDELRAIANRLEHPERRDPRWALAYTLDIDAGGRWRVMAHHNGAIHEADDFPTAVGLLMREQLDYARGVRRTHEELAQFIYEVLTTHVGTYTLPDVADIVAHRLRGERIG